MSTFSLGGGTENNGSDGFRRGEPRGDPLGRGGRRVASLKQGRDARISALLKVEAERVDRWLERCCIEAEDRFPRRLLASMRYSLLAGGKRLRPLLCLLGSRLFGGNDEGVRPMALALEMLHTASLIHDDLPSMDNDAMRRGKATNHVVFGEGLALLAGDSLLVWSFQEIAEKLQRDDLSAHRVLKALAYFAAAVGPAGVCGGQVYDSDPLSQGEGLDFVRRIATDKTARLIQAALVCSALIAGAEGTLLVALEQYGLHLGLTFQIVDDILDVIGDRGELGKSIGKDEAQGKMTFAALLGIEGARKAAEEETEKAVSALDLFGDEADDLRDLALWLRDRSR